MTSGIIGVRAAYACGRGTRGYEFAVAIADEWQARGIGAKLSHLLFDYARAEGIRNASGKDPPSTNRRTIAFAPLARNVDSLHAPRDRMVLRASRDL